MSTQNWNHLLEFIKLKLGVPTNLLEISDADIQKYIKDHVIPEISNVISARAWSVITSANLINDPNDPDYVEPFKDLRYRIPMDEKYEIIDVYDAYIRPSNSPYFDVGTYGYAVLDPRDIVMWNTYADIFKSLNPVTDYYFIRPNIIQFGRKLLRDGIILECRVIHTNLESIPSDVFHDIFKMKCLGEVMSLVAAQRSKYENMSTQFGTIPINWERLETKSQEILQEVESKLDACPPEYLIAWMSD